MEMCPSPSAISGCLCVSPQNSRTQCIRWDHGWACPSAAGQGQVLDHLLPLEMMGCVLPESSYSSPLSACTRGKENSVMKILFTLQEFPRT